ncbi:MAG TPA: helix-turn-helix domain-containing protein [Usitatibacter sp.]|jgi:DNA-binding transcriptional ArsR family regulator|nr:helix-turn-helix domain-containing protein [Usitatibacter sp.]
MKDGPHIAGIASLVGDAARAEMLTALLGGQALTATELAGIAGVTKQTASAHLAKLAGAKLVAAEAQGRHRYFRLADPDVARLLESLMGVAYRAGAVRLRSSPREPQLRKARVCYDHLAGELGVFAYESLQRRRLLRQTAAGVAVTPAGRAFFAQLGVEVARESGRRPLCRACLDWSERRHHLAGALGAALLERIQHLGWARRVKDTRVIAFTPRGEGAFRAAIAGDA